MSTQDDGGPAFPVPAELCQDLSVREQRGMNLRDYFAAKAMQARLAGAVIPADMAHERMALLARDAYLMADSMLEARKS